MAINAVAPWEGELIWKGDVNEYNNWKSIDFTLKYTNSKMDEEHITFNAFGEDMVNKVLSFQEGTMLKVVWWPKSSESKKTGIWYPKLQAYSVGLANPEVKTADTKITAPSFPDQQQKPSSQKSKDDWKNQGYVEIPPAYTPDEQDLPF